MASVNLNSSGIFTPVSAQVLAQLNTRIDSSRISPSQKSLLRKIGPIEATGVLVDQRIGEIGDGVSQAFPVGPLAVDDQAHAHRGDGRQDHDRNPERKRGDPAGPGNVAQPDGLARACPGPDEPADHAESSRAGTVTSNPGGT